MKTRTLLSLSLLLALSACGDAPADAPKAGGAAPTAGDAGHAENDHGARRELGQLQAFGRSFLAVQYGEVAAGAEAAFELEFTASAERIDTVRGWVGEQSGKGSLKSRWSLEGDTNVHGHVDVPAALGDEARLWIELELDGATETVSVAFR